MNAIKRKYTARNIQLLEQCALQLREEHSQNRMGVTSAGATGLCDCTTCRGITRLLGPMTIVSPYRCSVCKGHGQYQLVGEDHMERLTVCHECGGKGRRVHLVTKPGWQVDDLPWEKR